MRYLKALLLFLPIACSSGTDRGSHPPSNPGPNTPPALTNEGSDPNQLMEGEEAVTWVGQVATNNCVLRQSGELICTDRSESDANVKVFSGQSNYYFSAIASTNAIELCGKDLNGYNKCFNFGADGTPVVRQLAASPQYQPAQLFGKSFYLDSDNNLRNVETAEIKAKFAGAKKVVSVASGNGTRYCAILADDSVTCVDQSTNSTYEWSVPAGLKAIDIEQMPGLGDGLCYIAPDYSVGCLGYDRDNPLQLPSDLQATKLFYSNNQDELCFLSVQSTARCLRSEYNKPKGFNPVFIYAGHTHFCGISAQGSIRCWPGKDYGASTKYDLTARYVKGTPWQKLGPTTHSLSEIDGLWKGSDFGTLNKNQLTLKAGAGSFVHHAEQSEDFPSFEVTSEFALTSSTFEKLIDSKPWFAIRYTRHLVRALNADLAAKLNEGAVCGITTWSEVTAVPLPSDSACLWKKYAAEVRYGTYKFHDGKMYIDLTGQKSFVEQSKTMEFSR